MKVTESFHVEELVHPLYIEQHGAAKMKFVLEKNAPLMLLTIEHVKKLLGGGAYTVNNYMWHPDYKKFGWEGIKDNDTLYRSSGLRHPDDPVGAILSSHNYMNTFDGKSKEHSASGAYTVIQRSFNYVPYIVRMENVKYTPSWNHIQCGYRMPNQAIEIFKP